MNRIARLAGWLTGPTLTALLVTPTAASATGPAPDGPSRPQVVVEQVPVPVKVPVDDRTAEAVQMGTAAALGAAIATIATIAAAARRRRTRPSPAGTGAVDSSDTV